MSTFPRSIRPPSRRLAVALTLVVAVALGEASTAGAQTATRTVTPVPTVTATPALVRVAVSPRAPSKQVGQFQNFTVMGFFSNGSSQNFTSKVVYHSSDLSVVFPPNAPDNPGRVEAVGVGTSIISVTEPGTGVNSDASGESAEMEVVAAPTPTPTRTGPTPTRTLTPQPTATATPALIQLLITPLEAKRNVGQTQNFSVHGIYSNGDDRNLTQLATYVSSNPNVVQCPNNTATNKGETIAVGVGVAIISANYNGVTTTATFGDAEFTVVVPPTPTPTRTGPTPTPTLTALPTATATPVVVSIALSPPSAQKALGTVQNYSVNATFSDGSTKNITQQCVYSSSDPNVATAPNDPNFKSRVFAVGEGTATISAVDTETGIGSTGSGNATLEVFLAATPTPKFTGITPTRTKTPTPTATATPVLTQLVISPLQAKRNVGQTQNFSVHGIYSNGDDKNLTQSATYVSSNPNVVQCPNSTTTNKGETIAVGVGVAIISATFNGVTTTATSEDAEFTVVIPPTPTVTRTGPTPTPTLTALPTATATPVVVSIALSPPTASKGLGTFQNYSVNATFSDGSTKNITQQCVYSSSDPNVATAPNDPNFKSRVFAVGEGTATISAVDTETGIGSTGAGNATLEVFLAATPTPRFTGSTPTRTKTPTPTATATPVLTQLVISPLQAKRNVGQTQNFSVHGIYSNGDDKNLTQSATYVSSNPNVVQCPNSTTTNKGETIAVGVGVAIISATFNGVTTTATSEDAEFTVVIPPTPTVTRTGPTPTPTLTALPTATATPVVVSIALSPPSARKGLGTVQNYSVNATLSNGDIKNITQRCVYSSSDPNVATAPNDPNFKSRVFAVGEGTATISAVDTETGIGSTGAGNATLEVFLAPTPTPKFTGITPTRTKTPTPTATATPVLIGLTITPPTAKKPVGQTQTFIVYAQYSNGDEKNVTQKVDYISSNPAVAQTGTDPNSKSKVLAVGVGVAVIRAKDPATSIMTPLDESATLTVIEAPTPTPTYTGPTSTGPTPTPTFTASPTMTPTPNLVKIELKPKTAQKAIGTTQNFAATGTFSDGRVANVTGRVHYTSSDPSIAEAPNDPNNPSRIIPLKVGTVTISASDSATGVTSTDSNNDATFTVVQGSGSPRPRATVTPGLPDQTGGNPTTACQRDVRRAARSFIEKKLKTLEKCGGAAATCVQRKPNDPKCLPAVRTRCATMLGKLADDEAKLIGAVIKRCAGLSSSDVLGDDGLAYGDIANSCAIRFGRTLSDLTSVAQCLAAEHSCRAETLFALERPRAGELLRLAQAAPDAGACREDFGGSGLGVGDPKGLGKILERCVQALVRGGKRLASTRLASIGRCVDSVFVCVESVQGDAACLTKATQKCEREFARVQREVGKLTLATGKRCNGLDFNLLRGAAGANLDAVVPACPTYGIPAVISIGDYVACLVRQHECDVAELVRFESPRAEALLDTVGRTLVDAPCPVP